MKKLIQTKNADLTQKLGFEMAKGLKTGAIFALFGDLGSGKTTFVQGLAEGLGIKNKIISPTFIIVRKYEPNFYHVDLYRIEGSKDLESLGLDEILADKSNIVAIEWPEKIEKFLPKKRIDLHFKYLGDDKRQITINKLQ